MKIYLFVLLLLEIMSNPTGKENKFPKEKGKRKFNLDLYECVIKSETASEELKKYVEEYKDKELRKHLQSLKSKLNEKDLDILKECKKESFLKFRETIQKTFQEISSGKLNK